jgi:hypothetical protein
MKGGKGVEIRVEIKNGSVRYGGREKKGRDKVREGLSLEKIGRGKGTVMGGKMGRGKG